MAWSTFLTGVLAFAGAPEAQGQLEGVTQGTLPPVGRLNVFLDCEGPVCNQTRTFFRTEITWVNWVRDREDSGVHVIMTMQGTGSGGTEFQLDFLGRGGLDNEDDQLFYYSLGTDVEQEAFDGLTTTLAIGLARYAAMAGYRDFVDFEPLDVDEIDPDARVLAPQDVEDPWNLWVFELGASGTLDDTDTRDTQQISGNLSASRTTPTWKVIFGGSATRDVIETFIERDSSTFESTLLDWTVRTQIVYTLAAHWSVGLITSAGAFPRANQHFRSEVSPALEYSFFPYEEATRRALTVRYAVGPTYRNYDETTIFGELEETHFEESFRLQYSHRQPWGDGSISATTSHHLDDVSKHNVTLRANLEFRIARGLSLTIGANRSWVTDQIYISAEGETDEEILLNRRTRASNRNYGMNIGFTYRFGSIYNNVVNNRFPNIPGA